VSVIFIGPRGKPRQRLVCRSRRVGQGGREFRVTKSAGIGYYYYTIRELDCDSYIILYTTAALQWNNIIVSQSLAGPA